MKFLYCLFAGSGRDGYTMVARDLLEQLVAAGHVVDSAVLIDKEPTPISAETNRTIATLSRKSLFYRHPMLRGPILHWCHRIRNRLQPRRTGDRHFCPPDFLGAVRGLLEASRYDAAIATGAVFSRLSGIARCPTVVDLHELFTDKAKTLARHGVTGCISPFLGLSEELAAIRPFDLVWCPSTRSRRIIERTLPEARCIDRHISYRGIVPDGYAPPPPRSDGPGRILFVGSTAPENRPGLFLFLREILPAIRLAIPSVEFHVVGWSPEDLPPHLDLRNTTLHGVLRTREEILALFADTDLVAIPRFLGGLTVKGVEALCLGKAVVGHEAAFSGCYRIENWKQAVIAGDSEGFAAAILRLLRNPALRGKIAEEAWNFSRIRFSPERAYEDLFRGLDELSRNRRSPAGRRHQAAPSIG